ncbi:MAG: hypothetical protein M3Y21_00480 [Candidatus Eremiobacteraeota bacterium]|nr:hypothetical protein [Candidatus Eremiobacteraeota bacterium]
MPVVCVITLADCSIGFYFHLRGIARKPGGWQFPIVNMVMGPPIFAPLLFSLSAYLGLIASSLRRTPGGDDHAFPRPTFPSHWTARLTREHEPIDALQDARETSYQQQLAIAAGLSAFLSDSRLPIRTTKPIFATESSGRRS